MYLHNHLLKLIYSQSEIFTDVQSLAAMAPATLRANSFHTEGISKSPLLCRCLKNIDHITTFILLHRWCFNLCPFSKKVFEHANLCIQLDCSSNFSLCQSSDGNIIVIQDINADHPHYRLWLPTVTITATIPISTKILLTITITIEITVTITITTPMISASGCPHANRNKSRGLDSSLGMRSCLMGGFIEWVYWQFLLIFSQVWVVLIDFCHRYGGYGWAAWGSD